MVCSNPFQGRQWRRPPKGIKARVSRLARVIHGDHRWLYPTNSEGEESLRNTVKAEQLWATWDGFAPGNPGTDRANDDKAGMANHGPATGENPF